MSRSNLSRKRGSHLTPFACAFYSVQAALLCFAATRLLAAQTSGTHGVSGWAALLVVIAMVSVEQTRRYYLGRPQDSRVHRSRYSHEFLALAESSPDAVVLLEAERDATGEIL